MRLRTVTSDDCGLSEGINIATAELHQQGIINAASIITNYPAANHAFELFQQYPDLEIGAHLNLTEGTPICTDLESSVLLRSDGSFRDRVNLFTRFWILSDSLVMELERELSAQMAVFNQAGIQPQHVTTHMHFHSIPALRNIVLALAEKYDVDWVRPYDYRNVILNGVIPTQLNVASHEHDAHPFAVPDYLILVRYWMQYPAETLAQKLLELDGTVEIVSHPSIADDPQFPDNVRYPPVERHQETIYLQELWQRLQG